MYTTYTFLLNQGLYPDYVFSPIYDSHLNFNEWYNRKRNWRKEYYTRKS